MELLVLVPVIGLLTVYVAYKEWLTIAYRQWATELDLFKRRLSAYEQLKGAIRSLATSDAVSNFDTDRFARAMADMRFLFDEEFERFVSGIYDALLKKHALDALIKMAAGQEKAPTDQALLKQAREKSRQLARQIHNGIYRHMPEHMEKFMRSRPLTSPAHPASPTTR